MAIIYELNSKGKEDGKILTFYDSAFSINKCKVKAIVYDSKAETGKKVKMEIIGYIPMEEILFWENNIASGVFKRKYENSKQENGYYKPIYEIHGGSKDKEKKEIRARTISIARNNRKEGVIFNIIEGPGKETSTKGIVFTGKQDKTFFISFDINIVKIITTYYQAYITSCYLGKNNFPNLEFSKLVVNSSLQGEELNKEIQLFENNKSTEANSVFLRYYFGKGKNKQEHNIYIYYSNMVKDLINSIKNRGDIVSYIN